MKTMVESAVCSFCEITEIDKISILNIKKLLPSKRSRRLVSNIIEHRINSIQSVELRQKFMENLPVHRGEARSHNIFGDDRT